MTLPPEELRFDFQGACFDLTQEWDRKFLAWVFDQFLYGEVTGIQCGYWLYRAPHLNAASFLAKQAGEELSHVRKILRILSHLGEKPGRAHAAIRFLTTGMMGGSWGEHVALEMALGEGLVLSAFYAMVDTIEHPEIRRILVSSIGEEERHVAFGERETRRWLSENPGHRRFLLAQAVLQWMALGWLKRFLVSRIKASGRTSSPHPVLARFPQFYDHVLARFGDRVQRLGLSDRPLSEVPLLERVVWIASIPYWKVWCRLGRKTRLLTDTYLDDPWVTAEGAE